METAIAAAVIILLIGVGLLLLHRLNVRHEERIAAFHYSDTLPGIGRHRGRGGRGGRGDGGQDADRDADRDRDREQPGAGPAGRPPSPPPPTSGEREHGGGYRA